MKKTRKSKILETKRIKNPVAKFAHQFNKAQVFKDKTKYQRKAKHKGKEPFPITLFRVIGKGFCFFSVSFAPLFRYNEQIAWKKYLASVVAFLWFVYSPDKYRKFHHQFVKELVLFVPFPDKQYFLKTPQPHHFLL